jgi:hypothetical protein
VLCCWHFYVSAQCRSQVCAAFASRTQDPADCSSKKGVILRHEGCSAFAAFTTRLNYEIIKHVHHMSSMLRDSRDLAAAGLTHTAAHKLMGT